MKLKIRSITLATCLTITAPAQADSPFETYKLSLPTGLYLHAMYGQAKASDWCGGISTNCDDSTSAYGGGVGLEINEWFGLEASYIGMDKLTSLVRGFLVSADANFWTLTGVGTLPVNDQLAIQARIGAARWNVDAEVRGGSSTLATVSVDGTSPMVGAGLLFKVTDNLTLRLEYMHIHEVGDRAVTGESNSDSLGIGIVLRF